MIDTRTAILITTCLLLNVAVVWLVASSEGRMFTLLIYLAALGTGIAAVVSSGNSRLSVAADVPVGPNQANGETDQRAMHSWTEPSLIDRQDLPVIAAVMLAQLVGLIYMSTFPYHYVQDEFITGYTSYTLASITQIEWFAGYPGPGEWIAGFPILYYALQRPFIELFGLSLETIRVSTWPYHLLSATLVYLIGKEFFHLRPWAVVVAMIYILLAPNLYMAGYGMHNISSTFFFLAAFYAAIRMLQEDSRGWTILCGLATGMAYLTYTSSYLTLPLLGVLVGLWAFFTRTNRPLTRFGQVLIIVLVGLLPFLTYALTQHNYFTERGDQVNAISTFYRSDDVENPTRELLDHVWTNIQSLYTPGIGGVTDYWFGHQALFDWLTLVLLMTGMGITIFRGVAQRNPLELTAVAVVLATFVFGMFLTLPAGGFHRTTLAFPFVALLVALAIRTIVERIAGWTTRPRLELAMAGTLLVLFILINILALERMTRADEEISGLTDSLPIAAYVEDRVPEGDSVIVSSFPNYHLERELIVRTGDSYDVRIEPFDEAVKYGDDTVIILFQPPSDQTHRLEARYGGGRFVDSYDGRDLRRHLIWVPETLAGQ